MGVVTRARSIARERTSLVSEVGIVTTTPFCRRRTSLVSEVGIVTKPPFYSRRTNESHRTEMGTVTRARESAGFVWGRTGS